jgi:hypothetical protein
MTVARTDMPEPALGGSGGRALVAWASTAREARRKEVSGSPAHNDSETRTG